MDGLSAIRELMRRNPRSRSVLNMHKTEEPIGPRCRQAQPATFSRRIARRAVMAIQKRALGKDLHQPAVAERIVTAYLDRGAKDGGVRVLSDTLTVREKQGLKLIARAAATVISPAFVRERQDR